MHPLNNRWWTFVGVAGGIVACSAAVGMLAWLFLR